MKRNTSIIGFLAVIIFVLIMSGCQEKEDTPQVSSNEKEQTMTVTSSGIVNGVIEDKYGKRGTEFNENGIPTYSLPLKIENAPEGTVSYALLLEDKDAFPVSGGFSWVHWTAANITKTELKENESQTAKDFVQGVNSWMSIQGGEQSKELSSFYGGMAPPDAEHTYELHVYALDTMLNLENGFLMNDMYKQMDGHILAEYTLKGTYKN
ncbi:MAG: YbhB/YbcL family Raf kinase inhibitor-like protein [Bacillales bacterium]|nr:YbhB/YbcL family Raf kinase inhibitor-like protein [Bacillales bacterium]